jgi:hypothetical protein
MLLATLFFLTLANYACFVVVLYLKHHFRIVIHHSINMESCNLAHLYPDFWIDTSPFLTSIEVARLAMIGCKLLFNKFISSISSFIHRPRLQRHYSLPSLFLSFPNLLHLKITLPKGPEWRTIDWIDISLLPKSLKSLHLDMASFGNGTWLHKWISLKSSNMTLESLFPNLTSFTFDNQDWENLTYSTESILPLLSLPLTRLELPRYFHVLPSHISSLNHHTLLDLGITLPGDASSSLIPSFPSSTPTSHPSSPPITFPPNLTRLHIYNLPTKFPFILLPRTLLDLHIDFSPRSEYGDDDMSRKIEPEQLKDWPPNLTKLSVYVGDGDICYRLHVPSAIASSLPRTLTSLYWGFDFFENPNVLLDMPPNLTDYPTRIKDEYELISAAIPLLSKSLTSIHSDYLSIPSLWKHLPRTITSIEDIVWSKSNLDSDSSPFIQDLPPLLTHLRSYISFFQPSCPVLENITQLLIGLELVKPKKDWEFFFKVISTRLPHLEWLDLGGNYVDGPLLDILQQPLKRLELTCDPRTLNFISGKWSQSLQLLHTRTLDGIKPNQMVIVTLLERRDFNWRLPTTLTSLSSDQSLILLSPSSPEQWPPNLTHINISKLQLYDSTILWASLPSSLIDLEFQVENGKIDLLSNPGFIDSLNYLPPGMISFKLHYSLYNPDNSENPYLDSEGKFCFPKPILDLAKSHPRLACIEIGYNELDLSRSDCNPRTIQRQLRELSPRQTGGRKCAKKTTIATPYDDSDSEYHEKSIDDE